MRFDPMARAALVALAGGVLAASAAAQTQVLISDGFGDGDRDNDSVSDGFASDAGDTGSAWYLARGTGDLTVTVDDDSSGIGNGSALGVVSASIFTRPLAATFAPVTLEDGDRLNFRLTVRMTESPIDPTDGGLFPGVDTDRRFRFGVYNTNGTPLLTADNGDPTVTDDDTGYVAMIDVGSADGNSYSAFGDQADGILGGSSVSLGASDAATSNFVANAARTLEFVLVRSGDEMNVAIVLDGELVQDGTATAADIATYNLPFTFDYVAFGVSGGSLDYRVDDVMVEYTPAPESTATVDGFEDADRDNDGIPDGGMVNDPSDFGFTWYMSRGTSGFDVTIVDESAGIGTGNALRPYSITTSTRPVSAAIDEITLAEPGDEVTFAFDIRCQLFIPDSDRRFRFGIHSDGGTPVVEDSSTEALDDPGYMVQMDTGVSSESTATVRGDLPNGLFSGSTRSLGGTTEDGAYSLDDFDPHRLAIRIRRMADADLGRDVNEVTFFFDDVIATQGIDSGDGAGDTEPVSYTFNQISIGTSNVAFLDYLIDNVEVTTNVGSEPTGCNRADLAMPYNVLNFADVQSFLGSFGAGLPAADLAAPMGVFNFADVQTFLGLFGAGC